MPALFLEFLRAPSTAEDLAEVEKVRRSGKGSGSPSTFCVEVIVLRTEQPPYDRVASLMN